MTSAKFAKRAEGAIIRTPLLCFMKIGDDLIVFKVLINQEKKKGDKDTIAVLLHYEIEWSVQLIQMTIPILTSSIKCETMI